MTTVRSEYLTMAEVAERLRTNVDTLRYWRQNGKGPRSFKIGKRVLYDVADIEAYISEAKAFGGSRIR